MKNKATSILAATTLMFTALTTEAQLSVSNSTIASTLSNYLFSTSIEFKTSLDLIKPDMQAIKLKSTINTEVPEMGPLVSPDGKTIFFSRYNQTNQTEGNIDEEDIWFANWDETNKKWGEPQNIGAPLNNEYPNYVNSISADGNTILLGNTYYKNGNMKEGLSLSQRTNEGWGFPQNIKIDGENKCFNWTGCYLSNSNNVLIIACEQKKNNIGEGDLYVSLKKIDNTWSKPINLGSIINSKGLESAPFLSPDEKTLFYTSDGLGGYGGSDIFMSTRLDETWTNWSAPENLGSKVNSKLEESFFSLSPIDNKIYFSAQSDTTGNLDIFTLENTISIQTNINVATEITKDLAVNANNLLETTKMSIALNPVYFGFNKTKVNSEELTELQQISKLLAENPTAQIEITGHTDNIGSNSYNHHLSLRRAEHIAEFLVKNGISKDQIILKNKAATSPVGDNDTKEGRSLNRRVDFKIVTV